MDVSFRKSEDKEVLGEVDVPCGSGGTWSDEKGRMEDSLPSRG